MRLLGTTHTEGFRADVWEDGERCFFTGDLDVDADGANGQNGAQAAYRLNDKGSEFLGNGGMGMRNGRVVGVTDWWQDIVFQKDSQPLMLPNGVVPSKTAYKLPGDRPEHQLDSETLCYIVVPSWIVAKLKGIVKGCRAQATFRGKSVSAIVGDVGPRTKVGEGSIELCRRLGIKHSPRYGGLESPDVIYELWPGQFSMIGDTVIPLLTSAGQYLYPTDDQRRIARINQTGSKSQNQHESG